MDVTKITCNDKTYKVHVRKCLDKPKKYNIDNRKELIDFARVANAEFLFKKAKNAPIFERISGSGRALYILYFNYFERHRSGGPRRFTFNPPKNHIGRFPAPHTKKAELNYIRYIKRAELSQEMKVDMCTKYLQLLDEMKFESSGLKEMAEIVSLDSYAVDILSHYFGQRWPDDEFRETAEESLDGCYYYYKRFAIIDKKTEHGRKLFVQLSCHPKNAIKYAKEVLKRPYDESCEIESKVLEGITSSEYKSTYKILLDGSMFNDISYKDIITPNAWADFEYARDVLKSQWDYTTKIGLKAHKRIISSSYADKYLELEPRAPKAKKKHQTT